MRSTRKGSPSARTGSTRAEGALILNFARQVIPTHAPRHRLMSGTFGSMGVGLALGLGAKAACPDRGRPFKSPPAALRKCVSAFHLPTL